jgi:hypothetical protein
VVCLQNHIYLFSSTQKGQKDDSMFALLVSSQNLETDMDGRFLCLSSNQYLSSLGSKG